MRFLLSPPPEESMATRGETRQKQVVTPDELKEEEEKLGSSSQWGKEQLDYLGVTFNEGVRIDLNTILNVEESNWPEELRICIILHRNIRTDECRCQKG